MWCPGPIRSIFRVATVGGFGTTSNDGSVCLRAMDGSVLGSMFHHAKDSDGYPPFILDGTALSGGPVGVGVGTGGESSLVVSAGEDGSLMVWRGTELLQSIPHPTCVWAVAALPDGDFVTAGNDGALRVFSADVRKTDHPQALALQQQFEAQVCESVQRSGKGPSAEEIAKLPRWEDRAAHTGTSDGHVCVFSRAGKAIAAQWSHPSRCWVSVMTTTNHCVNLTLLSFICFSLTIQYRWRWAR